MNQRVYSNLERPAIDLNFRHFQRTKRGVMYIGTWLRDKNRTQPCLVLLHASRDIRPGKAVPVIIALDQVWRWAMHGETGDPAHCGRLVYKWMKLDLVPGNPENAHERILLWSDINDFLPDLIAMPPMPPKAQRVIGEAIMRHAASGETIKEVEVKQDV
jgi:hypothetical protein